MKVSTVFLVREQVESVSGRTYYWFASYDEPVRKGFVVPPYDPEGTPMEDNVEADEAAEEVRRRKFPDRPTRDRATFVFPTLEAAQAWASQRRTHGGIHEVSVTGRVFCADHSVFAQALRDGPSEEVLDRYWRGTSCESLTAEAIVDGKAVVTKQVVPGTYEDESDEDD